MQTWKTYLQYPCSFLLACPSHQQPFRSYAFSCLVSVYILVLAIKLLKQYDTHWTFDQLDRTRPRILLRHSPCRRQCSLRYRRPLRNQHRRSGLDSHVLRLRHKRRRPEEKQDMRIRHIPSSYCWTYVALTLSVLCNALLL